MFLVMHKYDEETSFGDFVVCEVPLFATPSREEAERFASKWDNERETYGGIRHGKLVVREVPVLTAEDLEAGPQCWPWVTPTARVSAKELAEERRLEALEEEADLAEDMAMDEEDHYKALLGNKMDHLF